MKAISAPVGARLCAMIIDRRVLNARPMAAQKAITRYRNIAIQADGTWMKMIRYESPC